MEVYPKLTKLLEHDKIELNDLNKIFEHYQAHHIIPVNLIKNNRNFRNFLEKNSDFDFNGLDNLLFINKRNHCGKHPDYDNIIENKIINNIRSVDDVQNQINVFKNKLSRDIIGNKSKITINQIVL